MTWRSHSAFNVLAFYAITKDPASFLVAAPLAWLPDGLERIFRSTHRGWSHSLLCWVLAFFGSLFLAQDVLAFLCLNGVLHVVADAFSQSGIPIFAPNGPRLALRCYSTGTLAEFLFLMLFGFIAYIISR